MTLRYHHSQWVFKLKLENPQGRQDLEQQAAPVKEENKFYKNQSISKVSDSYVYVFYPQKVYSSTQMLLLLNATSTQIVSISITNFHLRNYDYYNFFSV